MEIFNDHRKLFGLATALFVVLSFFVAILPAIDNQKNNAPLPGAERLSGDELKGKRIFIEHGCVACHTQQVRNVEMDRVWGARPGVAADYAIHDRMNWWMNTATLMGTERTGPDLTNIGARLPSADWHLLHLYNPRAVVAESIMPAYPWLFTHKTQVDADDRVVSVPDDFVKKKGTRVVASPEALQLVAYLQSLKQVDLVAAPDFLYSKKQTPQKTGEETAAGVAEDGQMLYANNCQVCHQASGEGLPGAFPPLKGSRIVLDDDPTLLIEVIMKGYNASDAYGEMPAVGVLNGLGPEAIWGIVNHERTSWGNDAREVSLEEVTKILEAIGTEPNL